MVKIIFYMIYAVIVVHDFADFLGVEVGLLRTCIVFTYFVFARVLGLS